MNPPLNGFVIGFLEAQILPGYVIESFDWL